MCRASTTIREVSCGDRMGLGWCEGGGDGVKRGRSLLFGENAGLTRGDGVQRAARSVPAGGEVWRTVRSVPVCSFFGGMWVHKDIRSGNGIKRFLDILNKYRKK